jgi:hypothetical protein
LYRLFVETAGAVRVEGEEIQVGFERRSHIPLIREAALDRAALPVPWLGRKRIRFGFG